jgi:hypothetical protein
MGPTKRYIAENKYVFSLKKKKYNPGFKEVIIGRSITKLIIYHSKCIIKAMFGYPIELYKIGLDIKKIWSLKKKFVNQRALIIGNGPSQGYLNKDELNLFKERGGVTICVNYWNINKNLSSHIPSWIVLSDPNTFKVRSTLASYLSKNKSIKILVPVKFRNELVKFKIKNEIFFFIDTELPAWRNINPILPRGYLSMTLYKALAWAVYLGFSEIGLIGMDNTYPRNIYVDKSNQLFLLQTHAYTPNTISLRCDFQNVAAFMDSHVRLFHHLDYFPRENIVNLDPYSLTDRFRKVEKNNFFNV